MFSSGPLVLGQVQPLYQHRVVVVVQVPQVGQHAPVPESQPSSYTRLFLYFTKVEKEKPLSKKTSVVDPDPRNQTGSAFRNFGLRGSGSVFRILIRTHTGKNRTN